MRGRFERFMASGMSADEAKKKVCLFQMVNFCVRAANIALRDRLSCRIQETGCLSILVSRLCIAVGLLSRSSAFTASLADQYDR